ncbi:MAG TPA: hypothetical protein VHO94_04040 [Oscillospiraceae bacterium]|nr:hypothetical protein [Oscillospiraceae bacterium]
MKALSIIGLALTIAIFMTACGNTQSASEQNPNAAFSVPTSSMSASSAAKDLLERNYKDTGIGTIYIATPSGTSESGKVPVLFVSKSAAAVQIGISVQKFNGSKLSYVYVDGKLNTKKQYATTDTSIGLGGDMISVGKHKVEVLQYDNDQPSGKAVTYKSASYEVKPK